MFTLRYALTRLMGLLAIGLVYVACFGMPGAKSQVNPGSSGRGEPAQAVVSAPSR